MTQTDTKRGYGTAIAIIVLGVLIAGAIIFVGRGARVINNAGGDNTKTQSSGEFRLPNNDDHTRGDPGASIAIVEFSDLECPFCARLHPTLARIVEGNKDVKWVYRHFPLSTIHSRALSAAVASECIARLGGNDAFWAFTDAAFSGGQLSDSWYKEQATSFGIDREEFVSCIKGRDIVARIETDLDEATGTGGRGTPYVVVVTPKGQLMPFSGALPYEQIMAIVEQARNN